MDQGFSQQPTSTQNYQDTNQPASPPKKSNLGKIFLIILVILIVLGAGGYLCYKYYFIKSVSNSNSEPVVTPTSSTQSATASIEGTTEKLIVELPIGFTSISAEQLSLEQYKSQTVVFICKSKDDCNSLKFLSLVFLAENKFNDYLKSFENTKVVLEKIKSSSDFNKDDQITEANINNFKLLKNETKLSAQLNMTEYYIFTNKSIFVINRTYPVGEPPYAQEEFEKMVKSFKILPK